MKVAITGGHGFLGWHLACRLRAVHGVEPVRLGREDFGDSARLVAALAEMDTVIHLAGINRAETDDEVEFGNERIARALVEALPDRHVHVVFADSVQAELDNPYGRGKRRAAEMLAGLPGTLADVLLPNLFGEHGRPGYNSFVATFSHELAQDRQPTVTDDKLVPLLHAQDAARVLIEAAGHRHDHQVRPEADSQRVSEVLDQLNGFQALYAKRGELPDLSTKFAVDLFNTYRSYLFPQQFPISPRVHRDPRGELFETARAHGGTGQAFVSTTRPGQLRGDHYHLHKVERFFVIRGDAEIALRRLLHDDVIRFRLSGDHPSYVDMPTMWAHSVKNVGKSELVTMFWADQLLDSADADQYQERVLIATGSAASLAETRREST